MNSGNLIFEIKHCNCTEIFNFYENLKTEMNFRRKVCYIFNS